MIKAEQLSVQYPNGHVALDHLSFYINKGESIGLVGANGAGKSTLFKSLLGLIPVSGSIEIDGVFLNEKSLPVIRKKAGLVMQNAEAQMFMPTVKDDILFGLLNYGMDRKEAQKRAMDILSELRIPYLYERANHTLSGGEKKMASIAVILALEPEILLMDEPTSMLDPGSRRRVIETINQRKETKLIASHDLDMILDTCNQVLLLDHGKLKAMGPAKEILADQKLLESCGLELPLRYQTG